MALAIREQQQSTAANTDFVFTLGAGTQVGDLVVLIQANDFYDATNLTTPTGTAVSSWTLRHTMDGGTNDCHAKVWTGPVTTGGAQTVDTNWTTTDEERFATVFVISGGATYADAASADTDTTSTNFVAPSVTPAAGSTDNILLCLWGHATGGDINLTVPGSMTPYIEVDFPTFVTFRAASEAYTASTATGTRTATGSAARDGFGVSVIISAAGAAVDAPTPTWQPPGLGGPFRIPSPWRGTEDPTTAAAPVAEGGAATVAGATTGTAVKVAAVSGSCTVGFAPIAIDKKVAPQGGSSTVGTAETAVEKKVGVEQGGATVGAAETAVDRKVGVEQGTAAVGTLATGLETTALTAISRPAVTVVSAPRAPVYSRTQPVLVLNGFTRGTTATAEQGTTVTGPTATATEVKVAKVAGTCVVGGGATGTAKKAAPLTGAVLAGAVITGADRKVFAESGVTAAGFRTYGSVSVWGPPPGLTATPISTTQIDLSWIAVALASGYDIERDGVVIATDVVGTTYSDTGLSPATLYSYRARSVHV